MSQKAIPIIDFDALITAINALSAPSATDVAVSTANMHYITEDDAQGALAELDAEAYAINSSLAQLGEWHSIPNSILNVDGSVSVAGLGTELLIELNSNPASATNRGRIIVPNITGACYYGTSVNGAYKHFRITISDGVLTFLAISDNSLRINGIYYK